MNREEEIKAANPYGNSSSFASGKMIGFTIGAEWADAHPKNPWISVKEQLPEENENIIIMCKHGAIFNGTYCNGAWFCMDGYINDIYKDSPIYTSMSSIPPLWEPVAWFPIPSFDEILEANKDVLERIKEKGDRIQTCSPMK